jgi:hypothetical protein
MTEPQRFESAGASALVWRDAPSWDGKRTAAIGGFACAGVSEGVALLDAIAAAMAGEGYGAVVGPMDGDTWHRYRVVLESDGAPPFLLEPVSGPHDHAAFEGAGFAPVSEYVSARGALSAAIAASPAAVPGVTITPWDGRDADRLVAQLFELSLAEFSRNRFFAPITREAFFDLYTPVLPLVDPAHVLFAHGPDGLVGFLFGIPDRLEGPQPRTVILKTYASRMRGVGHALADTFHRRALALGFSDVIHALMHVDNVSRDRSARHAARVFRRYALLGRELFPGRQ